jgi:hypothetical protein
MARPSLVWTLALYFTPLNLRMIVRIMSPNVMASYLPFFGSSTLSCYVFKLAIIVSLRQGCGLTIGILGRKPDLAAYVRIL